MSWSVSTRGSVPDVKAELERQFAYPLADRPAGLDDEGERETVRRVKETIGQCLDTFGAERNVLQAHYAKLLNMHDGGERMVFGSVAEWRGRLKAVRAIETKTAPG